MGGGSDAKNFGYLVPSQVSFLEAFLGKMPDPHYQLCSRSSSGSRAVTQQLVRRIERRSRSVGSGDRLARSWQPNPKY